MQQKKKQNKWQKNIRWRSS